MDDQTQDKICRAITDKIQKALNVHMANSSKIEVTRKKDGFCAQISITDVYNTHEILLVLNSAEFSISIKKNKEHFFIPTEAMLLEVAQELQLDIDTDIIS